MADVDEIADLLAPPPVVIDAAAFVQVPETAYDCQPLATSYDDVQWLGDPVIVCLEPLQVDAPPLALHPVPIPDAPISTPGSADVTAAGSAAEFTAATFSAEVSSLGPGGGIVTAKSDER